MIKLLRLLQGYIVFEAEGGFVERFLNLCKINNINLWNVRNNGVKITAFTTAGEFEALKVPAGKSGMEINIIKKCGLPFFAKAHKWRCGALLGVVLVAFSLWLLSGYIWDVEIKSNDSVKIENFTEVLEDLGVKTGAKKSKIDIPAVQEELLDTFSELSWVSVNIFGTKVQVEYSYAKPQKPIVDKFLLTNVVAGKNGKIIRVEGYSGTNMVKAGDYVTEKSLLISGIVKNADLTESFVHASGRVFAKTENKTVYEKTYKQSVDVIYNDGEVYKFKLFAITVPFGKAPENTTASKTDVLLKGNETVLPFGFIREDYFESSKQEICLSKSQCKLLCLLDGVSEKRENYSEADIEKATYIFSRSNEKANVTVNITCVEDIAVEVPVQME